ncbi:hypothetical protein Tco_0665422 [Tanacetum coccineum]
MNYEVAPQSGIPLRCDFMGVLQFGGYPKKVARKLGDPGEELTLRVDDEAITFKVGQTLRYSYNVDVSINRIDVIDIACEEYAQEDLRIFDSSQVAITTFL